MRVHTIGFSGKSAEAFFAILSDAAVERVLDIRRSHNTLYAGFTRSRDLPYFLTQLCGIEYVHEPDFAPSLELLRAYQARLKKDKYDPTAWADFSTQYLAEIGDRPVVEHFVRHSAGVGNVCLLCMEPTADKCHRRLLVEFLAANDTLDLEIVHL